MIQTACAFGEWVYGLAGEDLAYAHDLGRVRWAAAGIPPEKIL